MQHLLTVFRPSLKKNPEEDREVAFGVIDMTCGSGSTSKAAAVLGLHSLNYDTDQLQLDHCKATIQAQVELVRCQNVLSVVMVLLQVLEKLQSKSYAAEVERHKAVKHAQGFMVMDVDSIMQMWRVSSQCRTSRAA